MSTRTVEIRRATNLNSEILKIPYTYIQEQFGYSVASIQRQIHNEPTLNLGTFPDTFPQTVLEYYWIHTEAGSSNSWMALGKMTNGLYFFYTARCKNSPLSFLEKGAAMNLWVSWRYSELIHFAMNQSTYDLYVSETVIE